MSIDAYDQFKAAIGIVTPSANVVVERVTTAILSEFPEVSGHYSRTPIFGSVDRFPDDYDWDGMMSAARLLAMAKPDVITWSGSKGAAIGFAKDHEFCRRVTAETGIAASTSTVALEVALAASGAKRVAIATPFNDTYQAKLVAGFRSDGVEIVAEAHAGVDDNLAYASVPASAIAAMIREVAASQPDVIVTWCTNLPAAYLTAPMEAELGIPIFDSTALAAWHALHLAGRLDGRGQRWGSLFALAPQAA
jgi:maleate isomerase